MNNQLLNNLRKTIFWSLDTIKGSKIQREIKNIERVLSSPNLSTLKERTKEPLTILLEHAVNETEYYKPYQGYGDLSDFPVMDKRIITSNFEKLLSKSKQRQKLYKTFTSGSTGTPFMVVQNKEKKIRNTADTIFFASKAGFTIGDKLLYVRLWSNKLSKSKVSSNMQNIVPINIDKLNDRYIQELLDSLKQDKSSKGWLGYPSALEKICDYLDKNKSKPLDCNVKSIIGMSENLSDHVRSRMWYYFNSPMVSRYSNLENGIIAQQSIDSDHFTINWASYVLEILDFEKNEPVKDGELGRIVITDLYNHALPMIRYDTGDIGSITSKTDGSIPVLKTVEGRKADILLNTSGNMISAYQFMGITVDFPDIDQIQYVQTGKTSYLIKLNTEKPFTGEEKLVLRCKEIMGAQATIDIEYVDEIPLLSSKKRKITKNLMPSDEISQLVN
ncbi:CoF synthetase [Muricauda ruestringensis]|uniref:CoF synthetase n=1 Tax=Flagellimonas ruestringensis TaxID=111501 RepID=UPI001CD5202E|nr:CoF synthetase [Allomuricauda ruestringensis]MCA0959863.1 CoF synthetase [Allomuricauda ruestringensis]